MAAASTTRTGSIILTVAEPLAVSVTAAPSNIAVGESSQLLAIPSGGIPPYFYAWAAATFLDRSNVASPIATPPATETYTVTIHGLCQSTCEWLSHCFRETAAHGDCQSEQYSPRRPCAVGGDRRGGSPPYFYNWTPTDTLDDPLRSGSNRPSNDHDDVARHGERLRQAQCSMARSR